MDYRQFLRSNRRCSRTYYWRAEDIARRRGLHRLPGYLAGAWPNDPGPVNPSMAGREDLPGASDSERALLSSPCTGFGYYSRFLPARSTR